MIFSVSIYLSPSLSLSVEAVSAAESDLTALQKRSKLEEETMSNDQLSMTHSNVQEMIRDENSELDMMKQQCITDLKTIGEWSVMFWSEREHYGQAYIAWMIMCRVGENGEFSRKSIPLVSLGIDFQQD